MGIHDHPLQVVSTTAHSTPARAKKANAAFSIVIDAFGLLARKVAVELRLRFGWKTDWKAPHLVFHGAKTQKARSGKSLPVLRLQLFFEKAGEEIRTPDVQLGKLAFYH